MNFPSILFLSAGLAMDATAVAAARGMAVPALRPRHVLRVMLFFGGFQALMPLVGWLVGDRIGPWVQAWDHWIAFVLLGAIGGKMIWEARGQAREADAPSDAKSASSNGEAGFTWKSMTVLAIATSIDALAVGITLPMLQAPLVLTVASIGITTAVLSATGLWAGRRFGAMLGPRLDVVGGLVLMGLGTKILVEHLSAQSPG